VRRLRPYRSQLDEMPRLRKRFSASLGSGAEQEGGCMSDAFMVGALIGVLVGIFAGLAIAIAASPWVER
jgi:galactitol-specific phosphotransferase system IIC component